MFPNIFYLLQEIIKERLMKCTSNCHAVTGDHSGFSSAQSCCDNFLVLTTHDVIRCSSLITDCFKLHHHGPLQEQSLLVRLYWSKRWLLEKIASAWYAALECCAVHRCHTHSVQWAWLLLHTQQTSHFLDV